jgi:Asp-tRNA(Asn)/Glu-tRNA(Gln) amidotransferase A subunit family amidase
MLNTIVRLRLSGLRATTDGRHIGVGLEVGLMLVGEHFDKLTICRAAYAFEQSADRKKM